MTERQQEALLPKLLENKLWVEIYQEKKDNSSIAKECCRLRYEWESLRLKRKKMVKLKR